VTAPRPSEDELLRNAVMDRLSADPRLAGRIGVESFRHVVSLTGRVTTRAQVDRAETLARSVRGVRDVDNRLTSRVGMI
jgi:hyperosmotically inducible protein